VDVNQPTSQISLIRASHTKQLLLLPLVPLVLLL
jgi:hypothetical protein